MAGGIRHHDDDDIAQHSEINITPFIDVMLVLLIIFMVAAPLSTVDVAVNLPLATAKPQPRPEKPIFITLKPNLQVAVGETVIDEPNLIRAIDDATNAKREMRLFLRADRAVPYGEVLALLDRLRSAGYLKVGLVALEAGAAPQASPPSSAATGSGAQP